MSILLALDTATEACSVALHLGDEIIHRYEIAPRLHAQRVLPMVQELLAETGLSLAQVDAIAFGRGPGAFTACASPSAWCRAWPSVWSDRCCRCRIWRSSPSAPGASVA